MEFVVLKYPSLKVATHLKQQQIRALGTFFFFWNSSGLWRKFPAFQESHSSQESADIWSRLL
jgi:hypothetical protein